MQSLQDKASEWSGVAAGDAFAIDDGNVFAALGGTTQPCVDLATYSFTRSRLLSLARRRAGSFFLLAISGALILGGVNWVYEDEEEWFRQIFAGSKKEDAIRNQYEFLVQRMGGPQLFSQRRGN